MLRSVPSLGCIAPTRSILGGVPILGGGSILGRFCLFFGRRAAPSAAREAILGGVAILGGLAARVALETKSAV